MFCVGKEEVVCEGLYGVYFNWRVIKKVFEVGC